MATKLERGLALLKSLTVEHEDADDEHVWRHCRLCLSTTELQDHRPARMELALVLADYNRLKRAEAVLRGLRAWLTDSIETTRRKVSALQAKGLDCEAHELNQRITAVEAVLAKLDELEREAGK